ncbi:deoxyribodipyrimidine photo-lyase type I [Paraoerskovia marina]|uniref:Deoxyribodipyrimidine photo-lyase type I n=1 Tax=Paraoerskovia marina TaxID=545619 RepID=A0A1H1RCE1_9CELL|nr:deoxyribodipyrimidine photo-lyase [Paraoerskovia marina]SDS33355.1 deoxyribodipyrimidine photo-lyase type I [Paraoerskovia marina]
MTTLHWFRRDLRVADNPALAAASDAARDAASDVVPLFVLDPALWATAGVPRRSHLARSLARLDEALGGALVVRLGDPSEVVPALVAELDAEAVYVTAALEPYGRRRDEQVAARLGDLRAELRPVGSPYAVSPGRVRKSDGDPYQVFTPFHRAWLDHGWRAPAAAPQDSPWADVRSDPLPEPPETSADLPPAGEKAALGRWHDFLADELVHYVEDRDVPGRATSGLSTALKWGEIHPRTMLRDLAQLDANTAPPEVVAAYRRQLAWRDFHADVLFHHPSARTRSLKRVVPDDAWATGTEESEALERWATGTTGFPFVDAGMRELLATGRMHNRLRMVVASFLVKDLHVRWQRGAEHFMRHLVDGDVAQNQLNWQWVAGTGRDAAPYFRVFNPVTQGLKFDPDGTYVRRWVPELRHLSGKSAHEPWKVPDDLFAAPDPALPAYPERMVDHAHERERTLEDFARRDG